MRDKTLIPKVYEDCYNLGLKLLPKLYYIWNITYQIQSVKEWTNSDNADIKLFCKSKSTSISLLRTSAPLWLGKDGLNATARWENQGTGACWWIWTCNKILYQWHDQSAAIAVLGMQSVGSQEGENDFTAVWDCKKTNILTILLQHPRNAVATSNFL